MVTVLFKMLQEEIKADSSFLFNSWIIGSDILVDLILKSTKVSFADPFVKCSGAVFHFLLI